MKFGTPLRREMPKAGMWLTSNTEVAAILIINKTSYLRRGWSDMGEMWHADAARRMAWQLRWGQNRKWKIWRIENEKFLIGRVSPGCYSNVRACVFAGFAQLHNLLNSGRSILYAQLAGRFYDYAAEMAGRICLKIWIKFSRTRT